MFLLRLNNMRTCAQIENGVLVCWSDDREKLEKLMEQETVETYTEPKNPAEPEGQFWGKTFRAGGPLEWFNRLDEYNQEWERNHCLGILSLDELCVDPDVAGDLTPEDVINMLPNVQKLLDQGLENLKDANQSNFLRGADRDKLAAEIGNKVYAGALIFEQLEHAGRLRGCNGHHLAQQVADFAVELFGSLSVSEPNPEPLAWNRPPQEGDSP